MAHNVSSEKALQIICKDFKCSSSQILIIPQWAYHLDLQMAYLGQSQFIIHTFAQRNFNFNLPNEIQNKIQITFNYLYKLFENDIIDKVCEMLTKHHFSVTKVFGCLFYLNDINNPQEKAYVPYCKYDDDGNGGLFVLMNGISGVKENGEKYFLTARCDNKAFTKQFEKSLSELNTTVYYVDTPLCYDHNGNFDGVLVGIMGLNSLSEYIAYMSGGLRCQTSIVNKLQYLNYAQQKAITNPRLISNTNQNLKKEKEKEENAPVLSPHTHKNRSNK